MMSSFSKSSVFIIHTKHENGVFKHFYSEERFRKFAFSVTVFTGYVWTKGQSAKKKLRFQTKTDTCGPGPKTCNSVALFIASIQFLLSVAKSSPYSRASHTFEGMPSIMGTPLFTAECFNGCNSVIGEY